MVARLMTHYRVQGAGCMWHLPGLMTHSGVLIVGCRTWADGSKTEGV